MQKYNTCKSVILISYNLIFRHWQSISLRCQPCRFAYDFILDIQAAAEDSESVFSQLNFNTSLPSFHSSSKNGSSTKPLEDYYKNIPKALIKKIYSKYYLDFVLFGFSPASVRNILEAGTKEPSNYSYISNDDASFEQYEICNDPKETLDRWMKLYCPRVQNNPNSISLSKNKNLQMRYKNNARKCWNLSTYLCQK